MPRLIDMTGQRFERLLVEGPGGRQGTTPLWRCRCDCGATLEVQGASLRTGRQKSCGCLRNETSKRKATTHGLHATPEAAVWQSMKQRCNNPAHEAFERYGGRGIKVCDRWAASFQAFIDDMGMRPSADHSIERIDNSLGYEPGNCRWATRTEQASNTRRNLYVHDGEERVTLAEWCRRHGVPPMTAWQRLQKGLPPGPSATG